MGDKYRVIRNSDGSAHVMDIKGKHISTHEDAMDAHEKVKELRSAGKESCDPYYKNSTKNK